MTEWRHLLSRNDFANKLVGYVQIYFSICKSMMTTRCLLNNSDLINSYYHMMTLLFATINDDYDADVWNRAMMMMLGYCYYQLLNC